jgi:hypothetical protein
MPPRQDYASRIREQVQQAIVPHLSGLREEFKALQATLASSAARLDVELDAVRDMEIPMLDVILADAIDQVIRDRDLERVSLAHFARDMRLKETQEEILALLLAEAARFAPRVALFLIRGDRFVGWSSAGCSEECAGRIKEISVLRSESPLFEKAVASESLVSIADLSHEPRLFQIFLDEASGPLHAFPLRSIENPVAVLFAAAAHNCCCDLESLSLIVNITALCIENAALKILHEMAPAAGDSRPEDVPAAVQRLEPIPERSARSPMAAADMFVQYMRELRAQMGTPAAEEHPEPVTAPPPVAHPEPAPVMKAVETEAEEAADVPPVEEPPVPLAGAATAAEPAASPLPLALPVVQPEPAAAGEPAAQAAAPAAQQSAAAAKAVPGVSQGGTVAEPPAPGPEPAPASGVSSEQRLSEEEKRHGEAKRFARLLVSEIKLYNEQRVIEGRENRDIYVRLKRDIDRSRDMYQKRVSPSIARKIDYFHDEVVRILGDNDPSTLGSDYPGPLVES